jgi:hypothetical protein
MTYLPEHDYNTAGTGGGSFDLVPANTVARVILTIRPGSEGEGGWLTQSKSSDAQYLNCEFTITEGEYAKRKFWGNLTVSGGKVNEEGQSLAGNITRDTLRAILESARGIDPKDESDEAKRKRLVSGYGDFNDMEFVAKIGVEPARDQYQAKNKLLSVITSDKPEYSGSSSQVAGNGAVQPGQKPAWAGQEQPQTAEQSDAKPAWAK